MKTKPESALQHIFNRHSSVTDERTCQNRKAVVKIHSAVYLKFINRNRTPELTYQVIASCFC